MKGNDIHKERDGCLELLITLEHIIFNLNEENLDYSIQQTMELFDSNFSHSFNVVITYLVFYAYCSLKNEIDIYLKYLDLIQMKEEEINENITKIRDLFMKNVSEAGTQASYFLIQNFIDRNLRDKDITKNIASNYFAHYKTEIKNFFIQIEDFFHKNLEELKKNDWELHKKLIREGVNPNEIAKIIRNDEIEKLQEISSQNDFNFNQEIEPSLYERCDFINRFNIPLIHYAAFFGSIKCFKFLLLHNSKFKNVGKYAAAGGNIEIVHLCEQNNFTFKGACEAAIELHQNDIFRYIFDNKIQTFHNLFVLGEKCILYHNYEILSFLEEKGLEIESIMIINSAKDGNLYLLKHFFQNVPVSDYILGDVFGSRNIELIKYFISQKWININFKDVFKFYLKLISIIF